jgi:transcriptional regulator with XRE-family HTH domain
MMRNMNDPKDRLAAAVRRRRLELGLSERQAAERAEVARNTWSSMEAGKRQTAEHRYAGIERALDWEPGSIDAILSGRQPTARSTGDTQAIERQRDEEIELVANDPDLDNEMKMQIIKLIYERRERDRAAGVEETRRVIDIFKHRRGA